MNGDIDANLFFIFLLPAVATAAATTTNKVTNKKKKKPIRKYFSIDDERTFYSVQLEGIC